MSSSGAPKPFTAWPTAAQQAWRKHFEQQVVSMVVENALAFRFVDSESLRGLVQSCAGAFVNYSDGVLEEDGPLWSPELPILHRNTLRRRLICEFETTRLRLKKLLKSLPRRCVSISMDEATDRSGYSFLGIMCHFVDHDWNYRVACLDLLENSAGHSVAALRQFLDGVLRFYEIDPHTATTDNASNLCKLNSSSCAVHIRCTAHVVQLAARDLLALPEFATALADVEDAVSPLRMRGARVRLFEQLGVPCPGPAPRGCATRWNSEMRLIQHFLGKVESYRAYMCSEHCSNKRSPGHFTVLCERLQCLGDLLQPLQDLTDMAQLDSAIFALVLGRLRCLLVEWDSSDLLDVQREALVALWRRGIDPQAAEKCVVSSGAQRTSVPATSSQACGKRTHDETTSKPCADGAPPPWALPVGSIVRASSSRARRSKYKFKGRIQETRSDGSVVVAFDDGDVEVVSPCHVEVLKYGMRSRVTLTDVYIERVNSFKRPRKLSRRMRESLASDAAEYLWESDGGKGGEGSDSDSDSSSEEEDSEDDSAGSASGDRGCISISEDGDVDEESDNATGVALVQRTTVSMSMDSTACRRRAAAHILVHLGDFLRLDTPASALAFVLNPLTIMLGLLDPSESERVRKIANKALYDEVVAEKASPDPHANDAEHSSRVDVGQISSGVEVHCSSGILAYFGACSPPARPLWTGARENTIDGARIVVDRFWDDYFRLAPELCTSDDPLDFWRKFNATSAHDRTVLNVVRRYLGIPPSAAACERLFSTMTLKKRGRPMLGPQLSRSTVFLKANRWLSLLDSVDASE